MVYVISDNAGHVKIGVAVNVETRLKALQTANANELETVLTFECGSKERDKNVEQYLHCRFADYNIRNRNTESSEWFDDCILPELFALIEGNSERLKRLCREMETGFVTLEKQPSISQTIGEYERELASMELKNRNLKERIYDMRATERDLRAQIKEKNKTILGLRKMLKV